MKSGNQSMDKGGFEGLALRVAATMANANEALAAIREGRPLVPASAKVGTSGSAPWTPAETRRSLLILGSIVAVVIAISVAANWTEISNRMSGKPAQEAIPAPPPPQEVKDVGEREPSATKQISSQQMPRESNTTKKKPIAASKRLASKPDWDVPSQGIKVRDKYAGPRIEMKPAPGKVAPLSISELRYCRFERVRLESMKGVILGPRGSVSYDAAIDDYNSRCSNYTYDKEDWVQIERELKESEQKILSEAAERVVRWRGTGSP